MYFLVEASDRKSISRYASPKLACIMFKSQKSIRLVEGRQYELQQIFFCRLHINDTIYCVKKQALLR